MYNKYFPLKKLGVFLISLRTFHHTIYISTKHKCNKQSPSISPQILFIKIVVLASLPCLHHSNLL